MPRKKRKLDRDGGIVRDAGLVIIASEDTYAVSQYFRRFRTRRVAFKVLETKDCHSSPRDVMTRLDAYKSEEASVDGDQFWICIDTDHWIEPNHIGNLTVERVHQAIDRAMHLDIDDQVLPTSPASRVYKLIKVLLQRESINLDTQQH